MNYRLLVLVACACGVGAVLAADLPHYKPGLWEITLAMASKPAQEKICLDDATEKLMYQFGAGVNKSLCSKTEIHSSSSQFTADTVCKIGTVTRTSHSVMMFTGDTAYHTEITSHADPAGDQPDSKSTMDGKWLGACPVDMKPGDVVVTVQGLPQPMRMNLKAMLGK